MCAKPAPEWARRAQRGFRCLNLRKVGTLNEAGQILVVGEANVCRSPYIERVLAAGLHDMGIEVAGAGTSALVGQPMDAGAAQLLRDEGIDADNFVARQVTPAMLREADLVLTATRELRHEVVRLEPRALRYTHAILDFRDLVATADLGRPVFMEPPSASLVGTLAARAVTGRGEVGARSRADSGIEDPVGKRDRVYAAMARQVGEIAPWLVGAARDVAINH